MLSPIICDVAKLVMERDPETNALVAWRNFGVDGKPTNGRWGTAVETMTRTETQEGILTVYDYWDAEGNPALFNGKMARSETLTDKNGNYLRTQFTGRDGTLENITIRNMTFSTMQFDGDMIRLLDKDGKQVGKIPSDQYHEFLLE